MKTMSIIGIVLFSLSLILSIGFIESNPKASIGWGMIGMLYAIPFSIANLVNLNKAHKVPKDPFLELLKLNELKEKGIFTDEEYQEKKAEILKK